MVVPISSLAAKAAPDYVQAEKKGLRDAQAFALP
jgi:hypothetical protein